MSASFFNATLNLKKKEEVVS